VINQKVSASGMGIPEPGCDTFVNGLP